MASNIPGIKVNLIWSIKMAWRDGYASRSKLLLFISSIILGIAAVVSIQLFGYAVSENISRQSKILLGADFVIESRQTPTDRVLEIVDSLQGNKARMISFASMVSFPNTNYTKLVQVKAVEGDYPLYGSLKSEPESASRNYQTDNQALVDATVLLQYGLKPGDSIKIGNIALPIGGAVTSSPGLTGISSSIAPPVYIPLKNLSQTDLLQKGSRIEYEYYFQTGKKQDIEQLEASLEQILKQEKADLDTHLSVAGKMTRSYENFGRFLNIVGFSALLLGCIGVASAVNIYLKEKNNSVAILRAIGATRKQAFVIFLLQIGALGFLGSLIGTCIGLLLQNIFPLLVQEFIPVQVQAVVAPQILLMGIITGTILSVLFALIPLLKVWDVTPLQALRITDDKTESQIRNIAIVLLITFFIFIFALWMLKSLLYSAAFTVAVLAVFIALAAMGIVLMFAVKRSFPSSWSFTIRQSLLNLFRPNNQTVILVVSIGLGSFLISTLYFTKDILLSEISYESGSSSPNMIIFDIQNNQLNDLKSVLTRNEKKIIQQIPIVTMNIGSIRGKAVGEIRKDSSQEIKDWAINREYRVTYRDSLIGSEKIVKGKWYGKYTPGQDLYISIEDGMAEALKAEIGDELVFNVQGVMVKTIVGSIRAVDWRRLQTNFLVVFPEGVLESAPQFHVVTTKVTGPSESAKIQELLVDKFPNVSIVDLRQVLITLEDIITKISSVITFMALFSIFTGIVVLIGAVRTSKYQRIRESVLLRTLGAGRKQILRITALEYFFLGCFASLSGILLSFLGTYLLALYVFNQSFSPPLVPSLLVLFGLTIICVLIGILNSRSVISSPPLVVLRKEI